jgi:hypothetical protein
MRTALAVILGLALAVVVRPPAAGATDRDKFEKRVGKYATTDPAMPKALCHCRSGAGEVGYVVRQVAGSFVTVACSVPVFDGTGGFLMYSPCAVEWDVLSK